MLFCILEFSVLAHLAFRTKWETTGLLLLPLRFASCVTRHSSLLGAQKSVHVTISCSPITITIPNSFKCTETVRMGEISCTNVIPISRYATSQHLKKITCCLKGAIIVSYKGTHPASVANYPGHTTNFVTNWIKCTFIVIVWIYLAEGKCCNTFMFQCVLGCLKLWNKMTIFLSGFKF